VRALPSIQSLLLRIPDEFKPLAAIGIGALILVCLVLIHGVGLHKILIAFKRDELRLRSGRPHLGRARFFFGWAIFRMLALHILEITLWAAILVMLRLIVRPADAVYFCANAYTTLGYGTVDLGAAWRNISPIIAISGLFTFAWTASAMVSIVSIFLKLLEQLEVERAQELEMRAAARSAIVDVRRQEEAEEKTKVVAARELAGKTPFFGRHKMWKQERVEVGEMRSAVKEEMRTIHERERADEERLGDIASQNDPGAKK
jgi:hypothetical protein